MIESRLRPLLGAAHGATAVAVVAVQGDERAVLVRGPVDASTRFEIGSLTKTFTALLLAEMVAAREVRYDDSIDRYLPRGSIPGPPITLLHLATHTSGLPRLPPGMFSRAVRTCPTGWFSNPYADFSAADLAAALRRTGPRRRPRPGARVHYSNFGVGLLGHVLAHAAGGEYADLLAARVLTPLGLGDTDGDPDRPQAIGHWHGRPRPPWRIPGLPGAGALRSSARDLLTYLTALLAPATVGLPSLRAALHDVQRPRLTMPDTGNGLCLIWNLRRRRAGPLLHHCGGTRGFTAFAGFLPHSGTALAAVTATSPTLTSAFTQTAYEALCALASPDRQAATATDAPG